MIDVARLQRRLGVPADGVNGPTTMTALFARLGAKPEVAAELGLAAAVHFAHAGLLTNDGRLAHCMAQLGHESGGFRYMEEVWGPTPAQKSYEGRAGLGNSQPGDGRRYKGRGPIQITGRANYRRFGRMIGIDIERRPDLASAPSIGLMLACAYWTDRGLNALADRGDIEAVTRKINGGVNGLADRRARLATMKELLA